MLDKSFYIAFIFIFSCSYSFIPWIQSEHLKTNSFAAKSDYFSNFEPTSELKSQFIFSDITVESYWEKFNASEQVSIADCIRVIGFE